MKTTNKDCRRFVQAKESFIASNLQGSWYQDLYIVWSYKWYPVLVYSHVTRKWYENANRYSMSTAKQIGQARPQDQETICVSYEQIKELINKRGEQ